MELGAEVYVDERLRMGSIDTIEWIMECDLIFNTVQLYYLLRGKHTDKQIIWWLHEPPMLYKSVIPNVLKEIPLINVVIYSVSKVADEPIIGIRKEVKPNRLLYGMRDTACNAEIDYLKNQETDNHIKIVMIGDVCKLKGQDILIKALSQLEKNIKK